MVGDRRGITVGEVTERYRSAPIGNVFFLGAGTNMIWLDPSHDMVVVVRWLETRRVNAFIRRVRFAEDGKKQKSQPLGPGLPASPFRTDSWPCATAKNE